MTTYKETPKDLLSNTLLTFLSAGLPWTNSETNHRQPVSKKRIDRLRFI